MAAMVKLKPIKKLLMVLAYLPSRSFLIKTLNDLYVKTQAKGTVTKKRYSPKGKPKSDIPERYLGLKPQISMWVKITSQIKKKPPVTKMAKPKDLNPL